MKYKLKILLSIPTEMWKMIVTHFPGPFGFSLRYRFWKPRLKHLGKHVRIDLNVYFQNPQYISLDDNCWIDRNVAILAGPPGIDRVTLVKDNPDFRFATGEVYIGKNVHIAQNCVLSGIGGISIGKNSGVASNSNIYSFSHHYRNLVDKNDHGQYSFTPMARPDQQAMILGPIVIEDYCAVGLNSALLPGVTLKQGTWVASGSVVSGKYPEQTLVLNDVHAITKTLNLEIKV